MYFYCVCFQIAKMLCFCCGFPILSENLFLVGQFAFHNVCLVCKVCDGIMGEGDRCYVDEGVVYCKQDFFNMYGHRCGVRQFCCDFHCLL